MFSFYLSRYDWCLVQDVRGDGECELFLCVVFFLAKWAVSVISFLNYHHNSLMMFRRPFWWLRNFLSFILFLIWGLKSAFSSFVQLFNRFWSLRHHSTVISCLVFFSPVLSNSKKLSHDWGSDNCSIWISNLIIFN